MRNINYFKIYFRSLFLDRIITQEKMSILPNSVEINILTAVRFVYLIKTINIILE